MLRTHATLIAYRAFSDVVGKLCFFVIVILAARMLSREEFGAYSLASTLGVLLGTISDAGLQLHLAREVARRPAAAAQTLGPILRLRLILTVAVFAGAVALVFVARAPHLLGFVLILGAQACAALVDLYSYLYRGLSRSDIESTLFLAQRLTTLAAASLVLSRWPSLTALGATLAAGAAAGLAATALFARTLIATPTGDRVAHSSDNEPPQAALTSAVFMRDVAPIGLGIALSALYFRIDIFLVEVWTGIDAVAHYNAVFRLVEAVRLAPAAVLAVIFPALCRDRSGRPVMIAGGALFGLGVLAAAMLAPFGDAIVEGLYGAAFSQATPLFRILLLALPLFFLNYALTHQLIAWNLQRRYAWICGAALVFNLIGNALMIPRLGAAGAAWMTVWTEVVLLAGAVAVLSRRRVEEQPAETTALAASEI